MLRSLAAELGIPVPEREGGSQGSLEPLFRANQVAQQLYRRLLCSKDGAPARSYLEQRGLSAEDAERFGIGFAPDRWDAVRDALGREGIEARTGVRAGLLKARERGGHYDLLRGRITFPIRDVRGRVVGFGGRALGSERQPKYLNTPESPLFRKREGFYGFPAALEPIRRKDRAVVVEGYFDWIALQRAGIDEALATCGTALSEEHARNLRRRTRNVVLLFDGDEAGQRAALRALEVLLPHGLRVRAAALPAGVDPDDFLRSEGAAALVGLVDQAPPALELAISRAVSAGIASPWERADAVAAVVPVLLRIDDPVERGEWSRRLAWATGSEAGEVEAALRRALRGGGGQEREETFRPARRQDAVHRHFASVLGLLLDHPSHAEHVPTHELLADAPDEAWRQLAEVLLEAARGGSVDASALCDRLQGEARSRLSQLAAEERPLRNEPERALRALSDTLQRLGERRRHLEDHGLTEEMRKAPPDEALAFLLEKQRQLERRRASGAMRTP